jgi:uncharacterized protein
MNLELSLLETRVIGCLMEKEIATPEQYPLSMNALTNACNQKSNRDPVLNLAETTVQEVLDGLIRKFLVSEQSGYGSRVAKYKHRFCNSEYGTLKFSPQEFAIVCELFLRGPQTPGELRSHAGRFAHFDDALQVESTLEALATREDGPYVLRLPREPGKRESRYAHLFSGEVDIEAIEQTSASVVADDRLDRLDRFERRLAQLETEVADLKHRLGDD